MPDIVAPDDLQGLISAAERLRRGAVIVAPTDTNYGVFCDPFNSAAVNRIYDMKKRDAGKPLTLFVATPVDWSRWAKDPGHPGLPGLVDDVWPGPLNMILRKRVTVPDWVTAGKDSVAVVHNHCATLNLLSLYSGLPLAATSANISGTADSGLVDFEMALDHLGPNVDIAFWAKDASAYTASSTIVSFVGDRPAIVRQGDVSADAVRRHLPDLLVAGQSS
jgi:L-threonylcarbamoyladenylate synthase